MTATARTPGVLSVQTIDRHRTAFAIGTGPWVYATPAQVADAQERLEESDTGTVHLAGYWLDEQDVAALR